MSNSDFWRRVWFRKALLEDELAHIQATEARKENRNRKSSGKKQTTEDKKTADPQTDEMTTDLGEDEVLDERHRLETLRADELEHYLLNQGVSENES